TVSRVPRNPDAAIPSQAVRVARAAAPARPAVHRAARPAPSVRPVEAAPQPAKQSLLRRIADRLRGEEIAPTTAPAETASALPRVGVARLETPSLQPAPPLDSEPAET